MSLNTRRSLRCKPVFAATGIALSLLACGNASADDTSLTGEVGVGVMRTQSIIHGDSSSNSLIPYLAFDYGRLFARIDTFGIKTLKVGYGNIEILGRYRPDGYDVSGLERRATPIPLGIGTLQTTPIGAFEFNVTHDVNDSGGTIGLARYIAKIPVGPVSLYPEFGAEAFNGRYNNYYYGTRGNEAAVVGRSYSAGSATNVFMGMMASVHIAEHWTLTGYIRRTNFGSAVADSPLVNRGLRNSGFLAVAREF
jgi:outer membrane protein